MTAETTHREIVVSPNGYTDSFGPNVAQILAQGMRIVRGPIPARVRKDLRAAVSAGVLGWLRKDGLKPEIFYHPNSKVSAFEIQKREAAYSVGCIAQVTTGMKERFEAAIAQMERGA